MHLATNQVQAKINLDIFKIIFPDILKIYRKKRRKSTMRSVWSPALRAPVGKKSDNLHPEKGQFVQRPMYRSAALKIMDIHKSH